MQKRKGSRSIKDIPPEILKQLNNGEIESLSLVEFLAIDINKLLKNIIPTHQVIDGSLPFTKRIKQASQILFGEMGEKGVDRLKNHQSDMVRTLACGVISLIPAISLQERLEKIKPLANDGNVAVRENAWWFVREEIASNLNEAILILSNWALDSSANIRRFASEATRPRGVWCKHIEILKTKPELALPILEPLKADSSRYVQLSVANWLNDASKSSPKFVTTLCERWLVETNHSPHTQKIVKRGLRTIG